MKLFQTKIFHFFPSQKQGYKIQIMRGRGDSSAENSRDIIDGGIISDSDSEAMSDETEIDKNDLSSQGHLEQGQLEHPQEGSSLALVPSTGNRETLRSPSRTPLGLLDEISNPAMSERSSDNESQSSGSQFGGSQYNLQRGLK